MSHGPFSHVDILLPDGNLLGASDSPKAPVIVGNPRGVAIRPPTYQPFGLKLTMVIATPRAKYIRALAMTQLGKPFDNGALNGFLSDAMPGARNWRDPTVWFCSELVMWAFELSGYWGGILSVWPKNRISPGDMTMIFLFDTNWTNRDKFWPEPTNPVVVAAARPAG